MSEELSASEALFKALARPSVAVVIDWWKTATREEREFFLRSLSKNGGAVTQHSTCVWHVNVNWQECLDRRENGEFKGKHNAQ